jgi:hypothetical protein
MMPAIASATLTAFGEVELRIPYTAEDLRETLKAEIPKRHRTWDPDAKIWRVTGAYREQAITLLLEYFPRAEVPGDQPRRVPASSARTARPAPLPPLPPLTVELDADDQPEPGPLVASIRCPRCGKRHEQPVRVVTESDRTVAKQERPPAEFVATCPACSCVVIVSFWPAAAVLQEAAS